MNLLPQRGFQRSKRPAPTPQTKAPMLGPHRMAARKPTRLPMCQTPRGGGMATEMEVVMYTRAVKTLIKAILLEVGPRCVSVSDPIQNTVYYSLNYNIIVVSMISHGYDPPGVDDLIQPDTQSTNLVN